jgi:hypothetical protein
MWHAVGSIGGQGQPDGLPRVVAFLLHVQHRHVDLLFMANVPPRGVRNHRLLPQVQQGAHPVADGLPAALVEVRVACASVYKMFRTS